MSYMDHCESLLNDINKLFEYDKKLADGTLVDINLKRDLKIKYREKPTEINDIEKYATEDLSLDTILIHTIPARKKKTFVDPFPYDPNAD